MASKKDTAEPALALCDRCGGNGYEYERASNGLMYWKFCTKCSGSYNDRAEAALAEREAKEAAEEAGKDLARIAKARKKASKRRVK